MSPHVHICNGLLLAVAAALSAQTHRLQHSYATYSSHALPSFNLSLDTVRTPADLQVFNASGKALRDRINSVKNTQKITDAMKLVAAAKVRRAQDAVVNGRPFSENLVKVYTALAQHHRRTESALNLGQAVCVNTGAFWCKSEASRGGCGLPSSTDSPSQDCLAGSHHWRQGTLWWIQQPSYQEGSLAIKTPCAPCSAFTMVACLLSRPV